MSEQMVECDLAERLVLQLRQVGADRPLQIHSAFLVELQYQDRGEPLGDRRDWIPGAPAMGDLELSISESDTFVEDNPALVGYQDDTAELVLSSPAAELVALPESGL